MNRDDLLLYVDGQCSPEEAAEIERELAANPELRADAAEFFKQRVLLAEIFRASGTQSAPREQHSRPRASAAGHRRPWRATQYWVWIGAAAVIGIVAVLWALLTPPKTAAPLATVTNGRGTLERQGATLPATAGTGLQAGDRVRTAGDAVTIEYADKTTIALEVNTLLGLQAGAAKALQLDTGILRAVVTPQAAGAPLTITTPHAVVTVVGTEFTLKAQDQLTRLDVQKGTVRIASGGNEALVEAGHYGVATGTGVQSGAVTPAKSAEPAFKPVLRFDFESGQPAQRGANDWWLGAVVPGPAGGGKFSLKAERSGEGTADGTFRGVRLALNPICTYESGDSLRFSYWAGRNATKLVIQVFNATQNQNYHFKVPNLVHERWTEYSIDFVQLKPIADPSSTLKAGDRLTEVLIYANEAEALDVFIDHVEFVLQRPKSTGPR